MQWDLQPSSKNVLTLWDSPPSSVTALDVEFGLNQAKSSWHITTWRQLQSHIGCAHVSPHCDRHTDKEKKEQMREGLKISHRRHHLCCRRVASYFRREPLKSQPYTENTHNLSFCFCLCLTVWYFSGFGYERVCADPDSKRAVFNNKCLTLQGAFAWFHCSRQCCLNITQTPCVPGREATSHCFRSSYLYWQQEDGDGWWVWWCACAAWLEQGWLWGWCTVDKGYLCESACV